MALKAVTTMKFHNKFLTRKLDSELTILVPTYSRPGYLIRLISYFSCKSVPFRILIADSSEPSVQSTTCSKLQGFLNCLNLRYKTYSADIGFIEKISDALNDVDTDYTVLCADDDFIIPGTLLRGVSFLKNNPEYSIVHGEAYSFLLDSDGLYGKINFINQYNQRSIECNNSIDRFLDHMEKYSTTFYSIHRTSQLLSNFGIGVLPSINFEFSELMLSCLSLLQGKSKKLQHIYMLRQGDNEKMYTHKQAITKLPDWFAMDDWAKGYNSFLFYLSSELIKYADVNIEFAEQIVKFAFWNRYQRAISEFVADNQEAYDNLKSNISKINEKRKYNESIKGRFKNSIINFPGAVPLKRILSPKRLKEEETSNQVFFKGKTVKGEKEEPNLLFSLTNESSPHYEEFKSIAEAISQEAEYSQNSSTHDSISS